MNRYEDGPLLYAEWYDECGGFRFSSFDTYDEFHASTFCPDTKIVYLHNLKTGSIFADPARPVPTD